MKFEIVQLVEVGAESFVEFWSGKYSYALEALYDNNIGQPLTEKRVWELFKWKNTTEEISQKKQHSIRTIYLPELMHLPTLTTVTDGETYLETLSGGGAIWNIFWLHCINPTLFPIFDQHTYRAMAKIDGLGICEISTQQSQKTLAYFRQYISFTKRFTKAVPRTLDKALFAYGRFLKDGLGGK